MENLPEKYLLQYIVKKKAKKHPTWQDINEVNIAAKKELEEAFESGNEIDILEKTLKRIKYKTEKIGVMVSFVNPNNTDFISIGYSLCNLSAEDKFDYDAVKIDSLDNILYTEVKGLGKQIAFGRAESWKDSHGNCKIPDSIKHQFLNFILRSKRYYKEKKMPLWVEMFIDGEKKEK